MPKKKSALKTTKTTRPRKKTAVSKAIPKKKPAAKSVKSPPRTPAQKKPAEPDITLGRPLVTQEEKLYMLFKDDYHARQIFEFLRVATVKELEEFSPQQIVRKVSKPVFDTVDRIRAKLAEMKRSLRDDEQFASEYREHLPKN